MRNNAWKTVLIWSVASFGLTTAFLLPASLQADDPKAADAVRMMPPTINTDHFTLSLSLPEHSDMTWSPLFGFPIDPGPAPRMKIQASNKTSAALTIPVTIKMQSMAAVSRMSRVPSIPKEIWSYQREITLQPGASDFVEITSDAKLAAGTSVTISMSAGDKTVYPVQLAVKAAK